VIIAFVTTLPIPSLLVVFIEPWRAASATRSISGIRCPSTASSSSEAALAEISNVSGRQFLVHEVKKPQSFVEFIRRQNHQFFAFFISQLFAQLLSEETVELLLADAAGESIASPLGTMVLIEQ
jgi:hypothetical protein